ncbi:MAG: ABC transporter family substrate-binding protein [Egibacteraceae bacterium]
MRSCTVSRGVLAVLLALALATSACTGGGQVAEHARAPELTENDVNPVPRDQLRDGGTFRWPVIAITPNFNYYHADGLIYEGERVMSALMPWTFRFDMAGQPLRNPDLLESAELTAASPDQVVTYRINPRAVWSDGTPITWRDFEAQWRALNGANPAYRVGLTNGYDRISRVAQGADEREAVVTFATPYADWRSMYSPLYPASAMSDPDVFNTGWVDRPLATAGPFRFDSLNRTAQTITLVRNEQWWGQPAKLDRIIYRAIDGDAQVDALANGEIDFADVGPNVSKLRLAQTLPGVDLRAAGSPNFRAITFNGQSQMLDDVTVRQAIAMCINRETIARALLGPLGVPAVPLGNHFFMNNQFGYQDNSDVVPYDAQVAGTMLDEVGWTRQGEIRRKDGKELVLRFVIPSSVAESRQEAELVQGMLAELGVRVAIETVPVSDFFDAYIGLGNFDLTTFGFQGVPLPISANESLFTTPVEGPDGMDIRQNFARIGSPGIDAALDQAITELDPLRAIALANTADAMIWELVLSVPTYQRPDIVATNSAIANFGAFGFAQPVIYEDIGFVG